MLQLSSAVVGVIGVLLCTGAAGVFATEPFTSPDHPFEKHTVTADGYILELWRVPYGRNQTRGPRKVVFCMHGFLGGSTSFTYLGADYAIAYNLADAGFDVWMGNARGNKFSRRHVTLDPDINKRKFFNFSYEEIALGDLPAMFDYILDTTKQDKLHYIGHSQGGTVFFVLNSIFTAYHSKIASAHLLSPFGYTSAFPDKQLALIAERTETIYNTLRLAGIVEIGVPGLIDPVYAILDTIVDLVYDLNYEIFAGASVKQAAHLGMNVKYKSFGRFNYGPENLSKYGSITPPEYNLKLINIPVTIHYSLGDRRVSETDALAMTRDLPNAKARKVPDDSFAHSDYIKKKEAKALVTDYIIESLKNS